MHVELLDISVLSVLSLQHNLRAWPSPYRIVNRRLSFFFAGLVEKRPHPGNAFANIIFIVVRKTEAKVIAELSFD